MLATLLDLTEGEALPLPRALAERYGGPLRLPSRHVFANFVSTIDGVVSLALPGRSQASLISAGHPADRFVLALLRAAADAVIVGAGTLREEPDVVWSPEAAYPEAGGAFAELRAAMRRPARALTVLVSASGEIDLRAPAIVEGAPLVIATTRRGAARLATAPRHVRVRVMTRGATDEIIAIAAEGSGGDRILTEGGPTLFGQFVRERTLDELFLTVAPRIAGRSEDERRTSLVERAAFAPDDLRGARLLAVKRADDYLMLRFAMR